MQVGSSQIRWVIYLVLAIFPYSAFVDDVTILVQGRRPMESLAYTTTMPSVETGVSAESPASLSAFWTCAAGTLGEYTSLLSALMEPLASSE